MQMRRIGAMVFLVASTAVGPAGCVDFWDLDPPNRVSYEGEYVDDVVDCGEASFRLADYGVYANAEQISISDEELPILQVTGVTRFHYADGGDNLVEWTCEREIGNIPGRAEITSSEFLETHTKLSPTTS